MTPTIKILLSRISANRDDYYTIIVQHRQDIIDLVSEHGQVHTAKLLGMSQTKLSNILPILKAIDLEIAEYRLYYVTVIEEDRAYSKIGVTKNIRPRLAQLLKNKPDNADIIVMDWTMFEEDARMVEKQLKDKYKDEIFDGDPLTKEDIDYIQYLHDKFITSCQ